MQKINKIHSNNIKAGQSERKTIMSEIHVRATLKCVDKDSGVENMPIQIDLTIDSKTRRNTGNWSKFGVWGSHKTDADEVYPFVLLENGNLDFGAVESGARFGETNLLEQKIEIGSYVHVEDEDGNSYTYRISTVAEMGVGAIPNVG